VRVGLAHVVQGTGGLSGHEIGSAKMMPNQASQKPLGLACQLRFCKSLRKYGQAIIVSAQRKKRPTTRPEALGLGGASIRPSKSMDTFMGPDPITGLRMGLDNRWSKLRGNTQFPEQSALKLSQRRLNER